MSENSEFNVEEVNYGLYIPRNFSVPPDDSVFEAGNSKLQNVQTKSTALQPPIVHEIRRLNTSTWSSADDELLLLLISEFGPGSWHSLAEEYFGMRKTGPQLRSRYVDVLNPNRIRGHWTEEEDKRLIQLQQDYGNRWTHLQQHFVNRVANDLKNRFRYLQKKKQASNSESNKTSDT